MIIDFHTHIVPPRLKQERAAYAKVDRGFAAIYSDPKAKLATADELISAMDRDGVDMAVALNYDWTSQSLCVEISDYILESVARFPRRLLGFCTVAPDSGDAGLREIERCVKGGARGIGELRPDLYRSLDTLLPLARMAQAHHLILLTHASEPVGHQYAGKGKATPDLLYALVTACPHLTVVCAHWGGGLPFYALMPEVRAALRNTYFDTAASSFLYTPDIYSHVARLVGQEKILFGSDYPLIPQRRFLKEIRGLGLPDTVKNGILGGNAARLLGVSGD